MIQKTKNFLNRKINNFERKLRRYTIVVNPKIYRASSAPFISGDTFRKESDFVFDETMSFNPTDVEKNDKVFLKTDLKDIYFKTIHPNIKNQYILITHNSDENITEHDIHNADKKIIHWFAQNLSIPTNEKFSFLPIGFENRRYINNGKIKNLKKANLINVEKKDKILSSFNVDTNFLVRNDLISMIDDFQYIENKKFQTPEEYINKLSEYKFVLCPEGNGIDTHRIWEGLLTKTVPILINSSFSQNLKKLNIPILILKNWSELKHLNDKNIYTTYKEFENFEFEKFVTISYWNKNINNKVVT